MTGWTKLDHNIIHSTVWLTPPHIKHTWTTMLILADKDGYVGASVPGLAQATGFTVEQTEEALQFFRQPDKFSRTPDHEGRRIEDADGGWTILNFVKYRGETREEKERRWSRETSARYREKKRSLEYGGDTGDRKHCHRTVTVTEVTDNKNKNKKGEYEGEEFPGLPALSALPAQGSSGDTVGASGSSGREESNPLLLASLPTPVTDLASVPKSKGKKKPKKKTDPTTPGSVIFQAYADSYQQVYGKPPVRNHRVNSLCKQVHQLLGADGPAVAAYYPTTRNRLYVASGHSLQLLVRDAEKLQTEWDTGDQMTAARAALEDRRSTTNQALQEYLKEREGG